MHVNLQSFVQIEKSIVLKVNKEILKMNHALDMDEHLDI